MLPLLLAAVGLSGCAPVREYAATKRSERLLAQGWIALVHEQPAQAEVAFRQAARLRPAPDLLARIGLAYHLEGRFSEALPWLERAVAAQPRQPWMIHVALAAGYAASDKSQQAEGLMRETLLTMPNDAEVLNAAAYPMTDAGLLLDYTERILLRAVELAPEDGFVLDSLAWTYFRQGRLNEAVTLLEKALLLSDDREIRIHLNQARAARERKNLGAIR